MAENTGPPPEPLAITRADAVAQLGVSIQTLDRMIDRGEIRVVRAGRRVLIPRDEPARWLAEQLTAG
jgi:excisionase family DNA binding protein